MVINGMTIQILVKKQVGKDKFNHPIYEGVWEDVENVLIAPSAMDDVTTSTNLVGKTATYTLGIPKGDMHKWENTQVQFFGERWETVGIPLQGIDELIPGQWNKKVQVKRYE